MPLHAFRSFGSRSAALATAAVIGAGALLANFPAAAQQTGAPFSSQQCSDAISIANAVVQKYKGKISNDLIDSFVKFSESKCDLTTKFAMIDGTQDEGAFGEFRVRLVALRTMPAKRVSLTK